MDTHAAQAGIDCERFRLRRFLDLLHAQGELEIVEENVRLADIAGRLEGNPKAVLFRQAGPERAELVGSVAGTRRRLALAVGVSEQDLVRECYRRLRTPIAPVEVPRDRAPVQQVVLTGSDADFTRLPVHLQHGEDGSLYISASIDVTRSLDGSKSNIGYRRLMLRGRSEAGVDMVAPSDLRVIYAGYLAEKQRMPMSFVVGSNPIDGIAATMITPDDDEMAVMGGLRGAPVPLVRCVTNDLLVPADAEMILEGYLDTQGWHEAEGPYGEYVGYYGAVKTNPVFHLTAITHRRDAVFQTATISGRSIAYTDAAQLTGLRTELVAWTAILTAVREPVAVNVTPSSGGMFNLRLSLRQRVPGEARNAIAAVFGSSADVKNVFVMDDDLDVFNDAHFDWALASRFQPDRDLTVSSGFRVMPLDPSLHGARTGSKAGFDLTFPFGWSRELEFKVPAPPVFGALGNRTVRDALAEGPKTFRDLMEASGSRDGRDVLLALDAVRQAGELRREADGRYALKD